MIFLQPHSRYADFSGRSGRPEFWWFQVFLVGVAFVLGFVDGIMGTFDVPPGGA
ncbi:MAG: DUF805 domain-containing protein [Chloroflexi bacterium]|nr:DUF805 domain-containing protein [Chloroflexota bacterium]MDA1173270.1 DUF805 domain-containing protein [Chloroflexota bacterium]